MNRATSEVSIAPGRVRFKTVLSDSVESVSGSLNAKVRQYELLRTIADAPHLTACGMEPFQVMRWRHDGSRWLVECEAEADTGAVSAGALVANKIMAPPSDQKPTS